MLYSYSYELQIPYFLKIHILKNLLILNYVIYRKSFSVRLKNIPQATLGTRATGCQL